MKGKFIGIMATTGVSLVALAVAGRLSGAEWLLLDSVFQTFGVNVVIHAGLTLTGRFEGKSPALAAALDIGLVFAALMLFGAVFNWFENGTPPWMLAIISVAVYAAGWFMRLYRVRGEAREINDLLKNRR